MKDDFNYDEVTLMYTVGGHDVHYDNMRRSIDSVKRTGASPHFLILEFGTKLKSTEDTTVINLPDAIDFNAGKKVGYLVWKHKYIAALEVKTKYGIYVDSDTAMVNNNIPLICGSLKGEIGVTRHFWVPDIGHYQQRATTPETLAEFLLLKEKLGLSDDTPFYAGGVFAFENNEKNKKVFQRVLQMYDDYYKGKDYVKSITDELFFSAAINELCESAAIFGGALNHCSMGDDHMPMILYDNNLFGRNPFEDKWQPITFLHCDVSRRDPSECYEGRAKEIIRECFGLDGDE